MNRADQALQWLFTGGDGELQKDPFVKFPDLPQRELLERVLFAWPYRGGDGVFRDAVETVFCCAQDDERERVLPRVRELLANPSLTRGARSLAYMVWTDYRGEADLPALPSEDLEAVYFDYCASIPLAPTGALRIIAEYHAGLLDNGLDTSETIRCLSGTPYAFAYYLAPLHDIPWKRSIADALTRTGCVTTPYLLRLGLEQAQHEDAAEASAFYRHALEASESNVNAAAAEPEPWFQPAKFWISARDLERTAYLLAWVPTIPPAGTLVMLGAGPLGLKNGYCERRVPEASIPETAVMGRPIAPSDARIVLDAVREGFAAWARRHPPAALWRNPESELDAAVLIEHAAVQTIATFGL